MGHNNAILNKQDGLSAKFQTCGLITLNGMLVQKPWVNKLDTPRHKHKTNSEDTFSCHYTSNNSSFKDFVIEYCLVHYILFIIYIVVYYNKIINICKKLAALLLVDKFTFKCKKQEMSLS